MHQAMDQNLGQLAGIAQRQKDYSCCEETLGKIVQLRTAVYGEAHDGLLIPLLRIASFQRALQHNDMVLETCRKGLEHAKMCLENEDILESAEKKESVVKLLMEFYQMLFH